MSAAMSKAIARTNGVTSRAQSGHLINAFEGLFTQTWALGASKDSFFIALSLKKKSTT